MKKVYFLGLGIILLISVSCKPENNTHKKDYDLEKLVSEIEQNLNEHIIAQWYPRVIDSVNGGYLSGFDARWKMKDQQDKSLVYEARHLWSTSFIYNHYEKRNAYPEYQKQGYDFLKDFLWDKEYGGFYYMVDQKGIPLNNTIDEKRIYGQAFAIYALSEYYIASRDSAVLNLAKTAFRWIDHHAHDSISGGYFEFLFRDGTPIPESGPYQTTLHDRAAQGYKDYNSSIHVLEALAGLYGIWPDPIVKKRLEEMFFIIREKMVDEKGFLHLYFHADWELVSSDSLNKRNGNNVWFTNHITFGHDIETAYLLLEAAESLSLEDRQTEIIAKKMVDHSIKFGWDVENGGLFDSGIYNDKNKMEIIDRNKAWWSQIEALNSLLIMYSKYPDDPMDYKKYAINQWKHIDTYLVDHEFGGWYNSSLDTNPDAKDNDKAHNWKTSYHTTRGMINSLNTLKKATISGSSE